MKKTIVKVVNPLLAHSNLVLLRRGDWLGLTRDHDLYRQLVIQQNAQTEEEPTAEGIVFSKDRALQLHALLSSYFEQVDHPVPLHILYTASSERHAQAYRELFEMFADRIQTLVREVSFRSDLLDILHRVRSAKVLFLVDDIVFTRPVAMADFLRFSTRRFVPSLRLGEHLRYSYTMQREQPLPPFVSGPVEEPDKRCWVWDAGVLDWNYPLSVDGHLFATGEILALAERCSFRNPNSFENELQRYRPLFLPRFGVCYAEARIMNLPLNRVQTQNRNVCGDVHQDLLLDWWFQGKRIDYRKLYGFSNRSAHQEVTVELAPR